MALIWGLVSDAEVMSISGRAFVDWVLGTRPVVGQSTPG